MCSINADSASGQLTGRQSPEIYGVVEMGTIGNLNLCNVNNAKTKKIVNASCAN